MMQQDREAKSVAKVTALRELESALRETYPGQQDGGLADLNRAPTRTFDWKKTLGLVDKAAEALQIAEHRIKELEARHAEIVRLTKDQLQSAHVSINAAEARALDAEHQANEAEKEANHTQEWLARIHGGLEQLPSVGKLRSSQDSPQGPLGNRFATNSAGVREWPGLSAPAQRPSLKPV